MRRGAPEAKKDKLDFFPWCGLTIWVTVKGIIEIALTVSLFVLIASAVVLYALGRGPQTVAVPNVVGVSVAEAELAMSDAGLELIVKNEVYNTDVDEGSIVETRPAAGKVSKEGRKIEAIASLGTRTMTVPKVIGHDFKTARERVETAKLSLGDIVYRADASPKDHVLEQQPTAGKTVGRNHLVDLVLSGGVDYGKHELSNGRTLHFRSVEITVPTGQPLQRVKVQVAASRYDFRRVFYNRVRRPGEKVKVDVYGPQGATLKVYIEDDEVMSQKL